MANKLSNNCWYVDTAYSAPTDDLTDSVIIGCVVLTATSANARIVISDPTSTAVKLDLRLATSGETKIFDFSGTPINCPNGLRAATLTNAVATVVGFRGAK